MSKQGSRMSRPVKSRVTKIRTPEVKVYRAEGISVQGNLWDEAARAAFAKANRGQFSEDGYAVVRTYKIKLGHPLQPSRQQAVRQLPTCLAMPTLLLSKDVRNEVLADLLEWFDEIAETRGVCCARWFVAGKLLSAFAGQALKLADSAAGIVGKVRGRQKG